jgi:hypothetical protein
MQRNEALKLALSVLDSFKEAGNIFDDYKEVDGFTDEQYEEMLAVLRGMAEEVASKSRAEELFKQAVDGLREFYPALRNKSVRLLLRGAVTVPDTGNDQADYETVRDQIERLMQE